MYQVKFIIIILFIINFQSKQNEKTNLFIFSFNNRCL